MNLKKSLSLIISILISTLLAWFFVFNLELSFISSPIIDYALDQVGISKAQYKVININKNKLHLKAISAKGIKINELIIEYNLNGKLKSVIVIDSNIEVESSRTIGLIKPIKLINKDNDTKNIKEKPFDLKTILSFIPKNIKLENFNIKFKVDDLKGIANINYDSRKAKGTQENTIRFHSSLDCPCRFSDLHFTKMTFNSTLNITIDKESIQLKKGSFLIEPMGTFHLRKSNEITKFDIPKIYIPNVSMRFFPKRNIITDLKLEINPTKGSVSLDETEYYFSLGSIHGFAKKVILDEIEKAYVDISLNSSSIKLIKEQVNFESVKGQLKGNFDDLEFKLSSDQSHWTKSDKELGYLTPLSIKLSGTKKKMTLDVFMQALFLKQESLKLNGILKYDLQSKKGKIDIDLPALSIDKGNFSLANVSPFAAQENIGLGGNIGVKATFPISDKPSKGSLKILLHDISVLYNDIQLSYLNSNVSLLHHAKLTTGKSQKVEINRVKIGQIVENIKFYWLYDSQKIKISKISGEILGGVANISDIELDPLKKHFKPFSIFLSDLELYKVLSLGLDKGLMAKGKLDGKLNIKMNEKGVPYLKGKLLTTERGIIKYDNQVSNQMGSKAEKSVGVMVRYLKNMHFDNLEFLFESDEDYNLKVMMNLLGKNPKLKKLESDLVDLGGKSLKLKLNLDLNIMKAIQSYLLAVELPKQIEEKLINSLDFK